MVVAHLTFVHKNHYLSAGNCFSKISQPPLINRFLRLHESKSDISKKTTRIL